MLKSVNFENATKLMVIDARKAHGVIVESVDPTAKCLALPFVDKQQNVSNETMAIKTLKEAINKRIDRPTLIIVRDSVSIMCAEINNLIRKGVDEESIVAQVMSHKSWLSGDEYEQCEGAVMLLVDALLKAHDANKAVSVWKQSSLAGFEINFDTDQEFVIPEGTTVSIVDGVLEYANYVGNTSMNLNQDTAELFSKRVGGKVRHFVKRTGNVAERAFAKHMFKDANKYLPARSLFAVENYNGTTVVNPSTEDNDSQE